MADAHKNFAYSTVATVPSPAPTGTSLTVATGTGSLFPAVPFNAVVWPADVQPLSSNAEIVRVTGVTGDDFTIVRAQEGTSGRTHAVNCQIAAAITAKVLTDAEYGAHGVINVRDPAYGATGDGTTDDTAAIQAAIDAAAVGATVYFPLGQYKITTALSVTKYITLMGEGLVGYQDCTRILPTNVCDGIHIDSPYVTVRDLAVLRTGAASGITVDPAGGTFGRVGIKIGGSASATNVRLENVHVYYMDTGVHFAAAHNGVYANMRGVKCFYNQIGLAMESVAVWSAASQCDMRDNTVHGLWGKNAYCHFTQCLFEGNGSVATFTDAEAVKYGISLLTSGEYSFTDCYFYDHCHIGSGVIATVKQFVFETNFRWFGAGQLSIEEYQTSPNVLSTDMANDWTADVGLALTDTGDETRVQWAGATAGQLYYSTGASVRGQLNAADVKLYLFSVDLKVVAGASVAGFDFQPTCVLAQTSGKSDSQGLDTLYRKASYDWTDGLWHRLTYIVQPRFDVGYLDSAEMSLAYARVLLIFAGDHSVTNLDAYVKNPTLRLFATRSVK